MSPTNAAGGGVKLVVVESPTKARTIAGYLGSGYIVESSVGHIRDLPRGASDVPAKYKGEPWARLGVDVDHGFEPLYIIPADKKAQVAKLQARCSPALTSSSWRPTRTARARPSPGTCCRPSSPRCRSSGWCSTRSPRRRSGRPHRQPRELDNDLVDAQETRRILDRLYGYEVSPVLWKKVMPKLSAGRVQSVATRIVVERERERMAFHSAGYWGIDGRFRPRRGRPAVRRRAEHARRPEARGRQGRLRRCHRPAAASGGRAAAGRGGRPRCGGQPRREDRRGVLGRGQALHPVARTRRSRPRPCSRRAAASSGFSSERTMRAAQKLYESGYITYMRTDSITLSQTAHGRRPGAGPRAVRTGIRAGRAADIQEQGEERPGGARGDPSVRETSSAPPARSPGRSPATSSGSTS